MEIEIEAKSVQIERAYSKSIFLVIEDADLSFLKDIPVDKIVDTIDNDELLEALDLDYIKEKFGLKEIE